MAYSDKEIIEKIEAEARIKKPKVLNSKRSAFLNKRRSGGGGGDCYVYYGQDTGAWLNKNPPNGNSIVQIATAGDKTALLTSNGIIGASSNGSSAKYGNKAYEFFHQPNNIIVEFIIDAINDTLSFSQAYTPPISYPSGGGAVTAACAKDSNTILIARSQLAEIIEINLQPGGTYTYNTLFTMSNNLSGGTDIVYRPSDNTIFVVVLGSSGEELHQYSYNGTLLDSVSISSLNFPNMMFCHGGKIFIHDLVGINGDVYEIETNPLSLLPSTISYSQPGNAGDAASSPECCDTAIQPSVECYNIGDTGPEGGTIFAVPLGHPQNNSVNQTNFYYEVAKNDIATGGTPSGGYGQTCGTPGLGGWSTSGAEWGVHNKPNIVTSTDFGTGHKNTDAIDAYPLSPGNPTGGIHPWLDNHDIAATLCKQQPSAKDDWFLPSLDEFAEMVDASVVYNFNLGLNTHSPQDMKHVYWTSSQWRNDPANGLVIANPDLYSWGYMGASQFQFAGPNLAYRCHALSVRPIRRFECTPEPCPSPPDCNFEYNYRDGVCGRLVGSLCSYSYDGSSVALIDLPHAIVWGTTNQGCSPGLPVSIAIPAPNPTINYTDSIIGGENLTLNISRHDVVGNSYTGIEFNNATSGYKISVWDANYNFIGKWKYDLSYTGYAPIGTSQYDVPEGKKTIKLINGQHLEGNYPVVCYKGFYDQVNNNSWNHSATGCFFKIEWDGVNSYETGCNSSVFGNPHPYYSPGSAKDWPAYCGPVFQNGVYTGIDSAIPRYATFQPNDLSGNPITVYPDIYGATPDIVASGWVSGFYPDVLTMQYTCDCDYQIGDTGPAGGIIVATPWMNAGAVTTNGIATNHSQYYFELGPIDLNLAEWGNWQISSYLQQNLTGEKEGKINTDEMLSNYSPIPSQFPGADIAFDLCSNYALNNYDDWFLPSVEEWWFVRNNLPGTLNGLYWTSNMWEDQYPYHNLGTPLSITYNTGQYFGGSTLAIGGSYGGSISGTGGALHSDNLALASDLDTTVTNGGGTPYATEIFRSEPTKVRPMRRFACGSNGPIVSSSKRQSFINKSIKRPKETGPFGMLGYYPLYDTTKGATSDSPDSSYHIHEFNGKEYYMPNGLGGPGSGLQFHGDWEPKKPIINIENFEVEDGIDYEGLNQSRPEEQITQPEQQRITLPPVVIPEPEETYIPPPTPPLPSSTPTYTPPPSTSSGESEGGGY